MTRLWKLVDFGDDLSGPRAVSVVVAETADEAMLMGGQGLCIPFSIAAEYAKQSPRWISISDVEDVEEAGDVSPLCKPITARTAKP